MKISVILTTYNWPEALQVVLASMAQQTVLPHEVIIADDGSGEATAACVQHAAAQLPFAVKHVWHEDHGFRAAMIRNRALALARGEYIVFLDGDCVLPPWVLARHARLAEPGFWVTGNRVLLSRTYSEQVLRGEVDLNDWRLSFWWQQVRAGNCNSLSPLCRLPDFLFRKCRPQRWRGAKTCNLAVFKSDLLAINGFNEQFVGWGLEDSELVIRLIRYGVHRKEGRFATGVVHLWHPERSRSHLNDNQKYLELAQQSDTYFTPCGVDQYL